jgi:hypothetical protein
LQPGDQIVLEPSETGIVVRPLYTVISEVQAFFANIEPTDGTLLSEELIRDRREEAERESRD